MIITGFNPFLKDLVLILLLVFVILASIIAAYRVIREVGQTRELRLRELEWQQTREAEEMLRYFETNAFFVAALEMLDWYARDFEIKEGEFERIEMPEILGALRIENLKFTTKERYIRECFVVFFDYMERFEHYIRRELIDFEDVHFIFKLRVRRMAKQRPIFEAFLKRYYILALSFLERFDDWDRQMTEPRS